MLSPLLKGVQKKGGGGNRQSLSKEPLSNTKYSIYLTDRWVLDCKGKVRTKNNYERSRAVYIWLKDT